MLALYNNKKSSSSPQKNVSGAVRHNFPPSFTVGRLEEFLCRQMTPNDLRMLRPFGRKVQFVSLMLLASNFIRCASSIFRIIAAGTRSEIWSGNLLQGTPKITNKALYENKNKLINFIRI